MFLLLLSKTEQSRAGAAGQARILAGDEGHELGYTLLHGLLGVLESLVRQFCKIRDVIS